MTNRSHLASLGLLLCASLASAQTTMPAHLAPLKAGDRIVFFGDSITEQKQYTKVLEQYLTTRYPDYGLRFYNAGWGGDQAPYALKRIERDILPLKPTIVTVCLGMNDGGYREPDEEATKRFSDNMDLILKQLRGENIRVIVLSNTCVDDYTRQDLQQKEYNTTLKNLRDVAEKLASQNECEFIDLYTPMLEWQNKIKESNKMNTLMHDGVHPNAAGHTLIAMTILKQLAEPMTAAASVDHKSGAGSLSVPNVAIQSLYVEAPAQAVAKQIGFTDFTASKLVVKNAPSGYYNVMLEGKPITQASSEKLAAGIALPVQEKTSKPLYDLIGVKEDQYNFGWRQVLASDREFPNKQEIFASVLATDELIQKTIDTLAKEKPTITLSLEPRPGGENYAFGKPYTATSTNPWNWGKIGLTDGSFEFVPEKAWASDFDEDFPKSVTVDLGDEKQLASVVIANGERGSTKLVQISISADGVDFKDVGEYEFSKNTGEKQTISFDPANARFVRATFIDHWGDNNSTPPTMMILTELEAYGPAK